MAVPERREPEAPRATPTSVSLPMAMPSTGWRVGMESRVESRGLAASVQQRVSGVVRWELSRTRAGALRGRGAIDSFSVQSSLDSVAIARDARSSIVSPLLVDLVMDSTTVRVTPRPVLSNECDRMETLAASLAREVLIRIPDEVTVGSVWRDSTVSFVCRDGVPMTVTTVTRSRLTDHSTRRVIIERSGILRIAGSGGTAARGMEIEGEGTTTDRVELDPMRGTMDRLRGERTLTLRIRPQVTSGRPRVVVANPPTHSVVVTQRVTTTVDRLRN